MSPELIFIYSPTYERHLHEWNKLQWPPAPGAHANRRKAAQKLNELWEPWNDKVFEALSIVSGLKWKETEIRCYISAAGGVSFADPMTVFIEKFDWNIIFGDVMHELVHRLEIQFYDPRAQDAYKETFQSESSRTRAHIFLYAVLELVYSRLFGPGKTLDQMEPMNSYDPTRDKDYRRARELVRTLGAQRIIDRYAAPSMASTSPNSND